MIEWGYHWWKFKLNIHNLYWIQWRENFPRWIVSKLPHNILYFAFIRVAAIGEIHWSVDVIMQQYTLKYGPFGRERKRK